MVLRDRNKDEARGARGNLRGSRRSHIIIFQRKGVGTQKNPDETKGFPESNVFHLKSLAL